MSQTATPVAGGQEHGKQRQPFLQEHFFEMGQQFDTAKIGMWLFLATEVLMFGGLFVGFGVMQVRHPEAFAAAHHHLNRALGATNTVVLLVSSLTMVLAVAAAKAGKQKALVRYLSATWVLAGCFLVIKFFEYSHKFHEGLLPGKFYSYSGESFPGEFMFFSFYFMMTGLHGIHVLLGMIMILWLIHRARRGDFTPGYYTPVDLGGLYWHLVDTIWVYLFPLLYLIK